MFPGIKRAGTRKSVYFGKQQNTLAHVGSIRNRLVRATPIYSGHQGDRRKEESFTTQMYVYLPDRPSLIYNRADILPV